MPNSLRLRTTPGGLRLLVGCLVLLAGIWVLTVERIYHERESAIEDAVRQDKDLALAFEEYTRSTIRALEQVVSFMRWERESDDHAFDVDELAAYASVDKAMLTAAYITDVAGNVLRAKGKRSPHNVADLGPFKFHKTHPQGGLLLEKPRLGRMSGRNTLSASQRINKRDGTFAGVAVAGLDPEYIANFYSRMAAPGRLMLLVHTDGFTVARRFEDGVSVSDDLRSSQLVQLAKTQAVGDFASRGRLDGVPRFMSYRRLADYPLIVAVGSSVESALAASHERARNYVVAAAAATLLILGLAFSLAVSFARQRRALEQRAASEARYRTAFDQAIVGIAHHAVDGRYLKANARYCDMLGYREEELLRLTHLDVLHPEDSAFAREHHDDMVAHQGGLEIENRHVRKDGGVIWTAVSVSPVRDANGSVEYMFVMVSDITARKEAEAKLHEQLDELRRFQAVTVDRELRMIELKAELESLRRDVHA